MHIICESVLMLFTQNYQNRSMLDELQLAKVGEFCETLQCIVSQRVNIISSNLFHIMAALSLCFYCTGNYCEILSGPPLTRVSNADAAIHRVSKKLYIFVSVRSLSNFHKF